MPWGIADAETANEMMTPNRYEAFIFERVEYERKVKDNQQQGKDAELAAKRCLIVEKVDGKRRARDETITSANHLPFLYLTDKLSLAPVINRYMCLTTQT